MNEIIINEVIVVVVALCFLLLVGIIVWLLIVNSKKEKQLKAVLENKRELTSKIISYQNERVEKALIRKRKLLEIGFRTEYFTDGVSLIISEPTITHTVEKKEVNSEEVERLIKLALEEGRKSIKPIPISPIISSAEAFSSSIGWFAGSIKKLLRLR